MEFLKYFSIRYSYYIYTVLRSVLMLRSGLEFEREYSAVPEVYTYVCILFVHGTGCIRTQCTVWVAWSWCGKYADNAVEYCTETRYFTFFERYDTAFKTTAMSNIATIAYRTRTVFNT